MKVHSGELSSLVDRAIKAEPSKKEDKELFALLLAALANTQATTELRVPALQGEQGVGSKIDQVLKDVPDGTAALQLLLSIPKEIAAQPAALTDSQVTGLSEQTPAPLTAPAPEGDEQWPAAAKSLELAVHPHLREEVLGEAPSAEPTGTNLEPVVEFEEPALAAAVPLGSESLVFVPAGLEPVQPNTEQLRPEVPKLAGEPAAVTPNATVPLPLTMPTGEAQISAESLQQLRTEIIAFSNNPLRPSITLEISPPEYGRVMVSAERGPEGQVVIRLVVENPLAKALVAEQLPPTFAGTSATSALVTVFTTEEYQEYREQRRGQDPERQKRQRQRRPTPRSHEVEFVI